MFMLTSHLDAIGIRKLTERELDCVAGGETGGDQSCISELKSDISTFFTSLDGAISDLDKRLVG
jgi:hypothetical protein